MSTLCSPQYKSHANTILDNQKLPGAHILTSAYPRKCKYFSLRKEEEMNKIKYA